MVSLFTALRGRHRKVPAFNAALSAVVFVVFLALLFGRSGSLHAQSGGGVLDLSVEADPVLSEAGSLWTVIILVDYPVPSEVRMQPPALPSSLRLERIRVASRTDAGIRRTVVECDFLVLREESFTLGSFELSVPGKRALTPPLTVYAAVSGSPGTRGDTSFPRLFWAAAAVSGGGRGQLGALRTGEASEIVLCYAYPPGISLPAEARSQSAASWSYRPAPPVNAIMEVLPGPPLPGSPPISGQGETGVLLRLRIIPLWGPILSLPETRLILAGNPLNVPALELRINAGNE
jgi:hypothetical protein